MAAQSFQFLVEILPLLLDVRVLYPHLLLQLQELLPLFADVLLLHGTFASPFRFFFRQTILRKAKVKLITRNCVALLSYL